jgi:CBS domain-containing protein
MSSPVLSITKDAMVEEAARLMIRQRVRHLLVVNSRQEVVGIITATDLARYLKQKLASTIISANVGDEESSLAEVWELFF